MARSVKIAVTGASGLLGRETASHLSQQGEVIGLDITPGAVGKSYRYTDVLSLDALKSAFKDVHVVVHLAALQLGAPEEKIFHVNTVGTWNVLQAAHETGVSKVVLLSSECATGTVTLSGAAPSIPDYLPIDEEHPLRPNDAYGVSKLALEAMGRAFAEKNGMQIIVLRPTTVYAPGMEADMHRARKIDDPYMWLYVEIQDVVQAIEKAITYKGPAYDCFFVSAENTFAPEETLMLLKRRFGQVPVVHEPAIYEKDPFATIYDIRRLKDVLGVTLESDWKRYLNRADGSTPTTNQKNLLYK